MPPCPVVHARPARRPNRRSLQSLQLWGRCRMEVRQCVYGHRACGALWADRLLRNILSLEFPTAADRVLTCMPSPGQTTACCLLDGAVAAPETVVFPRYVRCPGVSSEVGLGDAVREEQLACAARSTSQERCTAHCRITLLSVSAITAAACAATSADARGILLHSKSQGRMACTRATAMSRFTYT